MYFNKFKFLYLYFQESVNTFFNHKFKLAELVLFNLDGTSFSEATEEKEDKINDETTKKQRMVYLMCD